MLTTKSEVAGAKSPRKADAVHNCDPIVFDAAIAKWSGFAKERMLELGFKSTDEFVKAIRGR